MSSLVVIRGGLSGRTETTRKPVSVRPSVGGSTHFKHAGRRLVRRDLGADAFARVQGFGGRQATTGHRSPNLFLGLGRALQPSEQTRSGLTDRFHLPNSLQTASASYEQEIIGAAHELGWVDQERGFFSQGATDG